jgi:succinylglutamate desuccinylase
MAALHGNEPAGVRAARTVLRELRCESPDIRGEILFLVGNRRALAADSRYVHRDLNRAWTTERVRKIGEGPPPDGGCVEDAEQRELIGILEELLRRDTPGGTYLLDLHTSSAAGRPFLTVGDTLRNRSFAAALPLPKILGLEEQVDGSLLEYLNNRGLVTLGLEAGRHDDAASEAVMIAVIRLVMVAAGMVREREVPHARELRNRLRRASSGIPSFVEVLHRHPIRPEDGFRMEPGYASFHSVRAGEVLARDRNGEIRAGDDGFVLLPLYQGQGSDGFFLAREVRRFWMAVSTVLRTLRAGAALPLLPGVGRHPDRTGVLVLDTRVTRWFPLEVLHLLGYRKLRSQGGILLASRRK